MAPMRKGAGKRGGDDKRPPFKPYVKVEYDDVKLYRPVEDPGSTHVPAPQAPSTSSATRPVVSSARAAAPSLARQGAINKRRLLPSRNGRRPIQATLMSNPAVVAEALNSIGATTRAGPTRTAPLTSSYAQRAAPIPNQPRGEPTRAGTSGARPKENAGSVRRAAGPTAQQKVLAAVAANAKKSALKRRSRAADDAAAAKSAKSVRFARRTGSRNRSEDVSAAPGASGTPAAGPGTPVAATVMNPLVVEVTPSGSPALGTRNSRNAGSTPWNPKSNGNADGDPVDDQSSQPGPSNPQIQEIAASPQVVRQTRRNTRVSKRVSVATELPALPEAPTPVSEAGNAQALEPRRSTRVSVRESRKSVLPTDEEFRAMHDAEVEKLSALRARWADVKKSVETWPDDDEDGATAKISKDDLICTINAADWAASKVMSNRLGQFKDLCDQRTEGRDPNRPVLPADLKGFWDLIQKPMEDAYKNFEELAELEASNWIRTRSRRSNVGRMVQEKRRSGAAARKKMADGETEEEQREEPAVPAEPQPTKSATRKSRATLLPEAAEAPPARRTSPRIAAKKMTAPEEAPARTPAPQRRTRVSKKEPNPDVKPEDLVSAGKKRRSVKKASVLTEEKPVAKGSADEEPAKKKRSTAAKKARGKSNAADSVEATVTVGFCEEVLDDVEPGMATTIGGSLVPEAVSPRGENDDDEENDENEPHQIIPSPSRIGLHRDTPGEKAFDALLAKPSFEHGHAQDGQKEYIEQAGKADEAPTSARALRLQNRHTIAGPALSTTPLGRRARK